MVNKTKKLFLGGLAQSTTETELNTYFEERWSKVSESYTSVFQSLYDGGGSSCAGSLEGRMERETMWVLLLG